MKDQEKNVLRMPEELIIDMNEHLPGDLTIEDIQRLCRGKAFKVWFICNDALMNTDVADMLDLSVRSSNALKRAGYRTVGDLIDKAINKPEAKVNTVIGNNVFIYSKYKASKKSRGRV